MTCTLVPKVNIFFTDEASRNLSVGPTYFGTISLTIAPLERVFVFLSARINDPSVSKKSAKAAAKMIFSTVIPVVDIVAGASREAANIVSPLARSSYAHRREQVSKKRELKNASSKVQPSLLLVKEFIERKSSPDSAASKRARPVTPTSKKPPALEAKRAKTLPCSVDVPAPKNGAEYGIGEFIQHAVQYRKGTKKRSTFISRVLQEKLVKRHLTTLHHVLRDHEVHGKQFEFDASWNDVGRPHSSSQTPR